MNADAVEAMMDSAEAVMALADSIRIGNSRITPAPVVNISQPPAPVVNVSAPVVNIPVDPRPRKYKIAITSRDHEGRWKTAEIEAI